MVQFHGRGAGRRCQPLTSDAVVLIAAGAASKENGPHLLLSEGGKDVVAKRIE